jgi:hypothetical protein
MPIELSGIEFQELSIKEKEEVIDRFLDDQNFQKKLELNAKLKEQNRKFRQALGKKDFAGIFVKDKNSNDLPGIVDLAQKLYGNVNILYPVTSTVARTAVFVAGSVRNYFI